MIPLLQVVGVVLIGFLCATWIWVLLAGLLDRGIDRVHSKKWTVHLFVHHVCDGDDDDGDAAEVAEDQEAVTKPGGVPDVRVN